MNIIKECIISWWLLVIIAIFIWYRNRSYDRMLSPFIFLLGVDRLIDYGIHSCTNPSQNAHIIFMVLWTQCFVLALGIYLYIRLTREKYNKYQEVLETFAGWNLIGYSIVLISALMIFLLNVINYDQDVINIKYVLGKWWPLYCFGILIPLFLLMVYQFTWSTVLIFLYVVVAIWYIIYSKENISFLSCFWMVGFAFLVWLTNI